MNTIPTLPETASKNGVIKLYYDEEIEQLPKKLLIKVVHQIIGNLTPESEESRTVTIWINDTLCTSDCN